MYVDLTPASNGLESHSTGNYFVSSNYIKQAISSWYEGKLWASEHQLQPWFSTSNYQNNLNI